MNDTVPNEIKWRGSSYIMDKVEDGKVYWTNATSRYQSSCPIEAWKRSDPYDGKFA